MGDHPAPAAKVQLGVSLPQLLADSDSKTVAEANVVLASLDADACAMLLNQDEALRKETVLQLVEERRERRGSRWANHNMCPSASLSPCILQPCSTSALVQLLCTCSCPSAPVCCIHDSCLGPL